MEKFIIERGQFIEMSMVKERVILAHHGHKEIKYSDIMIKKLFTGTKIRKYILSNHCLKFLSVILLFWWCTSYYYDFEIYNCKNSDSNNILEKWAAREGFNDFVQVIGPQQLEKTYNSSVGMFEAISTAYQNKWTLRFQRSLLL